jgi:hypothetical protein
VHGANVIDDGNGFINNYIEKECGCEIYDGF